MRALAQFAHMLWRIFAGDWPICRLPETVWDQILSVRKGMKKIHEANYANTWGNISAKYAETGPHASMALPKCNHPLFFPGMQRYLSSCKKQLGWHFLFELYTPW